jgi:hypothetical protein
VKAKIELAHASPIPGGGAVHGDQLGHGLEVPIASVKGGDLGHGGVRFKNHVATSNRVTSRVHQED